MGPRDEVGDRPASSLSSSSSSSGASSVKSDPGPGGIKRRHTEMEMECTGEINTSRLLQAILTGNISFSRFLWLWRVWAATCEKDKQNEHRASHQWSNTSHIKVSALQPRRRGVEAVFSEVPFPPGLSLLQQQSPSQQALFGEGIAESSSQTWPKLEKSSNYKVINDR